MTSVADPDDSSLVVANCSNSAGLSGSHIVTTTAYFLNGQISSTQSPSEYAAGVTTPFTYDADGNVISETHHYNGTAATTQKWYDGEDRLIEVELPADGSVDSGLAGYTRYFYDLSQNSTSLSVGNSGSFAAHGNLFKTQECLTGGSPCTWTDIKGDSYDPLDRATAKFQYAPGDVTIHSTTSTFDADGSTLGTIADSGRSE